MGSMLPKITPLGTPLSLKPAESDPDKVRFIKGKEPDKNSHIRYDSTCMK